jgi:MSHA biogenesis protein MshI
MGLLANILSPLTNRRSSDRAGVQFSPLRVHVVTIRQNSEGRPQLTLCISLKNVPTSSATIADIVNKYKLRNTPTSMVLNQQDYQLFPVDAPDTPKDEWQAAMQWQIQEHITEPASDMVVELFDIPARQKGEESGRIYVAAAQVSTIKNWSHLSVNSGLSLDNITIPELSLIPLAAQLPEQSSGSGLLQLDRKGGLLLIIKQQTLYIARTIINSISLIEEKNSFSVASQDEVALEVRRTMDFFVGTFDQPPINALYLLPSSHPLPGLQDALSTRLDIAVKEFEIKQFIDIPLDLPTKDLIDALPAIGAALQNYQGNVGG